MRQARKIFWDALLLTATSLLMRTVGIWFQVTVSNRAGAEVMGLYSLMAGVYGFALTLATSGIHLGVTRLVAELRSGNQTRKVKGFMKTACIYASLCGGSAAALLFSLSNLIGSVWLSDPRTVPSLRLFALSLPFIALSAVFGGYFTAVRKSYKNAGLQVAEQLVKISVTMYLFSLLAPKNTEALLCALVLGGVCSEIFSFLANCLLFCFDRSQRKTDPPRNAAPCCGRELLKITVPTALTSYVRSGLLSLQHLLIPRGLKKSGFSHAAALASYGCIHSMALPVILYPAALISSFSGLLIPTMAECHAQGYRRQIRYIVARVWFFAMLFSVGTAGILICFSEELGALLYPDSETAKYIRLLAPLIPIMYLDTATDAMLKGLGEQVYSMKINVADALISVGLVWLLVPAWGINGYIATVYVSELFNTVFSVTKLLSVSQVSAKLLKWVYQPLLCILAATYIAKRLFSEVRLPVGSHGAQSALHCALTALVYCGLLILTGTLNREELSWGRRMFLPEKDENKAVTKTAV